MQLAKKIQPLCPIVIEVELRYNNSTCGVIQKSEGQYNSHF